MYCTFAKKIEAQHTDTVLVNCRLLSSSSRSHKRPFCLSVCLSVCHTRDSRLRGWFKVSKLISLHTIEWCYLLPNFTFLSSGVHPQRVC